MNLVKNVFVEDTIEFIVDERHLYGVVEKKYTDDDGMIVIAVRVRSRLYEDIPLQAVITNFGSDQ